MEIQSNRLIAEVNLKNILHNLDEYKNHINQPKLKYLAVVKANAYSHGAEKVAKYIESHVDYFAVATFDESIQLRKAKINTPILLFSLPLDEDIQSLVENDIDITVDSYDLALKINYSAKKSNKISPIHICLDTGMSRIGFLDYQDYIEQIKKISKLPHIKIAGTYSHFADADSLDDTYTKKQARTFTQMCNNLEANGVDLGIKHLSNSAGALYQDYTFDMVRLGLGLYGYNECADDQKKLDLLPAMKLISHVSDVRLIQKGRGVGYSKRYVTKENEYIATLSIGYADGLSRTLSNKNYPILFEDGTIGTLVGNICMDQCMVKIPNKIEMGQKAYIFGQDNKSASLIADLTSTVVHDVLSSVRRVKIVYTEN